MEDSPPKRRSVEETTATAVSLPDDVLLEILFCIRDDRATLFRCATACKRWCRLIADPSFLRRCWPTEDELYSFVGFFAQRRHPLGREASIMALSFVPAPRSVMSPGRRALVSFLPSAHAGLLDRAELLASRHGLLLVRLAVSPNPTMACLAMCNPLAGTCNLLPPLNWNKRRKGYAIINSTDCRSGGPRRHMHYFKVLVDDMNHGVYTFSSDEASWSWTSIQCLDRLRIQFYERNAVVCHGTAHWLGCCNHPVTDLCTINVNAETGHLSVTKLVTNPRQYCFRHYNYPPCLSLDRDGTLSVMWMQMSNLVVEIWKQKDNKEGIHDDDTSTWHCTRMIELQQPHKIKIQGRVLHILGEMCGMLLVNYGEQGYVAHLETGIMEKVMDWPCGHISHEEARLFEMDWLEFFVSRLGSQ